MNSNKFQESGRERPQNNKKMEEPREWRGDTEAASDEVQLLGMVIFTGFVGGINEEEGRERMHPWGFFV